MEIIPKPEQQPENIQTLSPSSSGRNNGLLNSPEFEFWMVSNPSFPQPNLHSADELFVDGIILPLCLLSHDEQQQHSTEENPQRNLDDVEEEEVNETPICLKPETEIEPSREIGTQPGSGPESSASSSAAASTTVFSTSKRWRDIFKVGEKKSINNNSSSNQEESKSGVEKPEKRKDRKSTGNNTNNTSNTASGTNNSAELNINIWPFSRSRSAGNNNVNRPKVQLTRKISSAPCSRSNSGSESKSRKWPSSPSRGGGIHLGRSSPVWQVRRGLNTSSTASTTGMNKNSSEVVVKNADNKVTNVKKEGNANADNKVKKEGSESSRWSKSRLGGGSGGGGGSNGGGGVVSGLNLNVQMCMGYRQNSICRSDEHRSSLLVNAASGGDQSCSGGAAAAGSNGGNGVKMFNIRTLFSSKKVY